MITSTLYLPKYRSLVIHTAFCDKQNLERSIELNDVSEDEADAFLERMGWNKYPHVILK